MAKLSIIFKITRKESTTSMGPRNKDQLVRAAYRISEELGQEVEALVRSNHGATSEALERLYDKIRQQIGRERAKHVYEALTNALIPPRDQSSDSTSETS